MSIRNLDALFSPKTIAIIGASEKRGSVGQTVLANLAHFTESIRIFPVNPKHRELQGRRCFAHVGDVGQAVDLAVICTPAATVPLVIRECGQAGVRATLILSAGFREVGEAGKQLEMEVAEQAKRFAPMRVLGPNCLGFMAPQHGLNVSFVRDMPPQGNVAFVSQSGALCSSVLDWAKMENVGFSFFVSLGNMLDVGMADIIDYLSTDPATESIILYAESITNARQFMSAAKAFTRNKPIIAYKAGRFAASAKAATSHTGAMAGVDSVYEAAFARAGIVRVFEIDDLFDCAQLLARTKAPLGPRLAIVTNAGGPGVMATDSLLSNRGMLAELSDLTVKRLGEHLPSNWSHGNPVDIIGDATPERFAHAVSAVLEDEGVDGGLVILSPQAMTEPTKAAEMVIDASRHSNKPIITSWMGGERVIQGRSLLVRAGIPTYPSPDSAIRAFGYLVRYKRRRDVLYDTPRDMALNFETRPEERKEIFAEALRLQRDLLSEYAAKSLLAAYGIPVVKTLIAKTAEEAASISRKLGFPIAMKIFSPDITHKSEVGGVELNLATESEVEAAFDRIVERARTKRPDAHIDGVTVQQMVVHPNGRELIVGAKRDPVFGSVLLVGSGGIAAEVLGDHTLELPPLTERRARRMLESLRIWPLLRDFRGKPGVAMDRLYEVLLRFSQLIEDCPEILELDVNPLLATPEGVIAIDARVVVDLKAIEHPPRPFSHLAIRPYPDELIKRERLRDTTPVLLRPIRPEDEPSWHEFLRSCSPESIHRRFGYLFKTTTHEMATRFCHIDYDRELAIVAEVEAEGRRKLVGVSRLSADADHTSAEFAILVADAWHGKGIGSLLMDYGLKVCRDWKIDRIVAETSIDNERMIAMFRHRGFSTNQGEILNVVRVEKGLHGDSTS
jgi:acetyltransferase